MHFTAAPSSLSFIGAASLSPLLSSPPLCSALLGSCKVVWDERTHERRRRCAAVCALMPFHTVARVPALIASELAGRWERLKTADVWTWSFAGLLRQHALGGDPVWRAGLTIFYTLGVLLIPPEVFLSSVFVYFVHVGLLTHYKWAAPLSSVLRFTLIWTLLWQIVAYSLHLHACARACLQINSLRKLLRLNCSNKDSCLKSRLISIISVWLSCLCHITSRLAPVCFSIFVF